MSATERRDHIRAMLADLRLPGALEAVDEILQDVARIRERTARARSRNVHGESVVGSAS